MISLINSVLVDIPPQSQTKVKAGFSSVFVPEFDATSSRILSNTSLVLFFISAVYNGTSKYRG